MELLLDHAHLIQKGAIVSIYQHASTMQVFKTVELPSGFELFIMNNGVWHSEGILTQNQILYKVANPDSE